MSQFLIQLYHKSQKATLYFHEFGNISSLSVRYEHKETNEALLLMLVEDINEIGIHTFTNHLVTRLERNKSDAHADRIK